MLPGVMVSIEYPTVADRVGQRNLAGYMSDAAQIPHATPKTLDLRTICGLHNARNRGRIRAAVGRRHGNDDLTPGVSLL